MNFTKIKENDNNRMQPPNATWKYGSNAFITEKITTCSFQIINTCYNEVLAFQWLPSFLEKNDITKQSL